LIPLNIISLERSHERRAFMQCQLDDLGLPFRFFNAIDGSNMTTAKKIREVVGVKLTPGEIGCALSHLAVIQEIAEGEHEYAAILEDDVFILPEVRNFLNERYLRSLPAFDILQLDGNHLAKLRLTLIVGNIGRYQLCALTKCHHIMFAQIYTRETARRIAASISNVTAPIDNMIFQDRRPFGLRVIEVRPSVVRHNDEFASAIGPRVPVEGFFPKLVREMRRFCNWAADGAALSGHGVFGGFCAYACGVATGARHNKCKQASSPRSGRWRARRRSGEQAAPRHPDGRRAAAVRGADGAEARRSALRSVEV
jgi:glycosyl transferase family 25